MIAELIEALKNTDEVAVTFITKKGLIRIMNCTTNEDNIPDEDLGGDDDPKLNGDAIITVYDYDNSSLRAFRKDSVISYEVVVWVD